MESNLPIQSIQNSDRHREILLIILISLGILGLLSRGAYLTITSILNFSSTNGSNVESTLLDAFAMLFCASLLLPVLYYALRKLKGFEIPPAVIKPIKIWQGLTMLVACLLDVTTGAEIAKLFTYGWIVAAPLFLLGISLPISLFIWIGAGGLLVGSRRRMWAGFGYGMVGSSLIALILEYLLIGCAILVIELLAMTNAGLAGILNQIKAQVANAKTGGLQDLVTVFVPYISNPLVISTILFFAALVAPLIEEAAKPAVIWFVGRRLHSPAEGFTLGALCGAGFATFEGLLSASSTPQIWSLGLTGRVAASLMHITASGLMGWAIASALLEKRYVRLIFSYFLSVSIHGSWNGFAILTFYGALRTMEHTTQVDLPGMVLMVGGVGMLILELVLMIILLPLINLHLRRESSNAIVQSDIISTLDTSNWREIDGMDSTNN